MDEFGIQKIILSIATVSLLILTGAKIKDEPLLDYSVTKSVQASFDHTITIDYSLQTATGHPLIFGGAHTPDLDHQNAWDLLAESGITMIRRDFWIENELPKGITLDQYKNNENSIQDPANWNTAYINETNHVYKNAQKRGMKVMAILSYAPPWLTYSGDQYGVPKDWEVYEDIVKKSYRIHRPYLDMIEIWNEPDIQQFLDISGSGISRSEAYTLIFEHAVNAIKTVDEEIGDSKNVMIIAPAVSNPLDTTIFDYLLARPASKYLDGVSIHSYDKNEPSWSKYQAILKKYGKQYLPIYVTEWNKTGDYIIDNKYTSGEIAIPYTGKKLIQFLKYGIAGANYFSTTYFNPNDPSKYTNSFGIYKIIDGKSEILPQGKSWQILSSSLGLGLGESKIFYTENPINFEAIGFSNEKYEKGFAVVNESISDESVQIILKNTFVPKYSMLKIYLASTTGDPTSPACTQQTSEDHTNPSFILNIPKQSIVGVVITPTPNLTFNSILKVLGISTSSDCILGSIAPTD